MGLRIVCVFLMFLISLNLLGQDPEFSQYYANPLYLNPALTGTTEYPRTTLNYRNQWPNSGPTFTTYSISYDRYFTKAKAGLGIQVIYDREWNNVIISNTANFFYSYHIKLSEWDFITAGLQAGITQKQFDPGKLIFPTMIDQLSGAVYGSIPSNIENGQKIYPDFGVGIAGQHDEIYWGVNMSHLTKPNESIIDGDQKGRLPRKLTLHGGAILHRLHRGLLSKPFTLSPNIIYQHQGSFKQLNLGVYLIEQSITLGAWYRNNISLRPDAIIALVGFTKERFKFGYSFDFTLSRLSGYSKGTHEISLMFFLGKKVSADPRDVMQIPSI